MSRRHLCFAAEHSEFTWLLKYLLTYFQCLRLIYELVHYTNNCINIIINLRFTETGRAELQ